MDERIAFELDGSAPVVSPFIRDAEAIAALTPHGAAQSASAVLIREARDR